MNTVRHLAAALALSLASVPALAADHWVATWTASPFAAPGEKVETTDITLREIAHLSLGGSQLRITLSNEFGTDPLLVGGASIGVSTAGSAVDPATLHAITFGGQVSVTIAPGATVESDAIGISVAPLANVAVSLLLPAQKVDRYTQHGSSMQTNFQSTGDQLMAASMPSPKEVIPWRFLTAIDTNAPARGAAIVCFGDSITDGATSTRDTNQRWPNLLAARLQADPAHRNFAVVDEGIGGNRILHEGTGPSAVSRWKQDALDVAGVKYIILLEGINDIGHSSLSKLPENAGKPTFGPDNIVTADQLTGAMSSLIDQAHARGIKVIGATLTPYQGAGYARPDGQEIRDKVNAFIRTGGKFDAVIDFDKATQDPKNPLTINPALNIKDHLHPNDAGYKAMADSIDLSLFQ